MSWLIRAVFSLLVFLGVGFVSPNVMASTKSSDERLRSLDELSALWSSYRYKYIVEGARVISPDEGYVTTSEGQGYALLRALWSSDRQTFARVWNWTRRNLQVRDDALFAWKWKGRVKDKNSATDADTDIALALLLGAQRFSEPEYERQAKRIIDDIWDKEILHLSSSKHYVVAGNWAPGEAFATVHVAYLAPYAYEIFGQFDRLHPWKRVIESSYEIFNWLYFDKKLKLPPELVYVNQKTGELELTRPGQSAPSRFSYDAFPIYWRVAADARWHGRSQVKLRKKMLEFFEAEWDRRAAFYDNYSVQGDARSRLEALPLYATIHSLAERENKELARKIWGAKLKSLWQMSLNGKVLPYYLQNWIWFDRALMLGVARGHEGFFSFLSPFDFEAFADQFPWLEFGLALILFCLIRFHPVFKAGFLALSFLICARYLYWRATQSLNFLETSGPWISMALLGAELYCFLTVILLLIQVGVRQKRKKQGGERPAPCPDGFSPSVDVFIPIYSESCEILEKTLIGACNMAYANKKVHVLDDSHRAEVAVLAAKYGAGYIRGPRKHAKAGNLNHALTLTNGELVVVFDTDHIPVTSFLCETVPSFSDPKVGFIQTPHHFYNEDIFQRALGAGWKVPDEQDMFNHGIQGGRDHWNGTFFVGSGAVFRRQAIAEIGGFNLMSITEDIHTSQHLHARGWKSRFIGKDLAVGLTAENLSSYLVQRRRWMQGCLQIFFKDNPLFCRGLGFRQRLGYFASLYYFLFPIPRVIFWATPLCFLVLHAHPLFADFSVLMAHLIPYMILTPLVSMALLPGWPRMLWGVFYEMTVSFALLRGMLDMLLPKSLGFKVTPKGITSQSRTFDVASSRATLVAAAITAAAIVKGVIEFEYFGIEQDAYFFNLAWATFNFGFLLAALLIAWERPQRRVQDRIQKAMPLAVRWAGGSCSGVTRDISLGGVSFCVEGKIEISSSVELEIGGADAIRCRAKLVRAERVGLKKYVYAFEYVNLSSESFKRLVLAIFADPETWREAHRFHTRSNTMMCAYFTIGLIKSVWPQKNTKPRRQGCNNEKDFIEESSSLRSPSP